jgi:V8-like Glu-specific endopeptidase
MKEKLHKNIVAIIWRNNLGLVGRGSGLLISPDLVLTCAHNLYNDRFEIVN